MANELYRQSIHIGVGLCAALCAALLSRSQFLALWGAILIVYILSIFLE